MGPEGRGPVDVVDLERTQLPEDAKLVRVPATDSDWVSRIPPVPGGCTVTVSCGDAALAAAPADDLVAHGLRIAGILTRGPVGGGFVDLLVPGALIRAHPSWWRELRSVAERTFSLAHGPVQVVFADVLAIHAAAASADGPFAPS